MLLPRAFVVQPNPPLHSLLLRATSLRSSPRPLRASVLGNFLGSPHADKPSTAKSPAAESEVAASRRGTRALVPLAVSASASMPAIAATGAETAEVAERVAESSKSKRETAEQGDGGRLRTLEELPWENTFVDELPGDSNSDNSVRIVRNACYSLVRPSLRLSDPQLVATSARAAVDCLGLDPEELERPEVPSILTGGDVPRGCKPYAQCYGGHQFGSWAGQLGDGRAITLGEVVSPHRPTSLSHSNTQPHTLSTSHTAAGTLPASPSSSASAAEAPVAAPAPSPVYPERWEVQFKGVGKTPYSRMADGRAVLRSSIREFLCSEAMHALGIPTTRALSVATTGEEVLRDMFYDGNAKREPGAAVCRLAPSFVRFGTFQLPVSRGGTEKELARLIADYTIRHHFQHLEDLPEPEVEKTGASEGETAPGVEDEDEDPDKVDVTRNKYAAWFAEVAERTGRLVAGWQSVGFTHGVLNTDNISILGLTIDYGPFGFLDEFDPMYTPNTTDLPGRRYCYQRQPDVVMWNVVQLANALHAGGMVSVAEAQHCVSRYAEAFISEYGRRMAAKVGLEEHDKELVQDLLTLMAQHSADFTNTFRALAYVPLSAQPSGSTGEAISHGGVPQENGSSLKEGSFQGLPTNDELLRPLESVLGLREEEGGLESVKAKAWAAWCARLVEKVREEQGGTLSSEFEERRRAAMLGANPKFVLRNYLCQEAIEAAEQGDFMPTRRLLRVLEDPYAEQEGEEDLCQPAPAWAKRRGVCMLSCSS